MAGDLGKRITIRDDTFDRLAKPDQAIKLLPLGDPLGENFHERRIILAD